MKIKKGGNLNCLLIFSSLSGRAVEFENQYTYFLFSVHRMRLLFLKLEKNMNLLASVGEKVLVFIVFCLKVVELFFSVLSGVYIMSRCRPPYSFTVSETRKKGMSFRFSRQMMFT